MIALVLGAIKILIPIPDTPDAIPTKAKVEVRLTSENKYIATEQKAIPITDGTVVPILSASRPLIGPKIAIKMDPGNKYNAAVTVVNSSPETRKNGIKKNVLELAAKDINLEKESKEKEKDLNRPRGNIGFFAVFSLRRNAVNNNIEHRVPKII